MNFHKKAKKTAEKAAVKVAPKKPKVVLLKTYLFWLTSNRGSDEKAIWELPAEYKADDIKAELEGWCARFPAWSHGENMVHYGYKPIKVIPRTELSKKGGKWEQVCAKYAKAKETRDIYREMLNVRKWGV